MDVTDMDRKLMKNISNFKITNNKEKKTKISKILTLTLKRTPIQKKSFPPLKSNEKSQKRPALLNNDSFL